LGDTIGALQAAGKLADGFFNIATAVDSNTLAGAVGSPMGVVFYAGTTTAAQSGLVYNNSVIVPTPNWPTPPLGATVVEPDVLDPSNWLVGPNTARTTGNTGFYIAVIPEPSTMLLVGMGLIGSLVIRRRKA
jgi:hypothetical protein